jgi:hypothetical protein
MEEPSLWGLGKNIPYSHGGLLQKLQSWGTLNSWSYGKT